MTTNYNGNYIFTVMTALAGGGYSNATLPGAITDSVISADFNHDSRPDLAFADAFIGAGVKLALPGGGFSATTYFSTVNPSDITYGDFNHDGHVDLVTASLNYNVVSLLTGNGDGTFTSAGSLLASANGTSSVIVADFDGNGHDDIAVAAASGPFVDIFYQVPEPGTIGILSAGLVMLIRRRKKARLALSGRENSTISSPPLPMARSCLQTDLDSDLE